MAYQNVGGTPRFYIDIPSYLNSLGIDYAEGFDKNLFGLNPHNPILFVEETFGSDTNISLPLAMSKLFDSSKGYIGFLNYSMESDDVFTLTPAYSEINPIINCEGANVLTFYNSGFSMYSYNSEDNQDDYIQFKNFYFLDGITHETIPLYLGCLTFGSYYDMPNSPDLDLSMEIEYGGINNTKTLNGSTITQANYQGSPWWYDVDGNKREPWAIGESTGISKRNGRRIWSMKFSYVSDKNLFASNYGSSTYLETDTDYDSTDLDTDTDNNNIFYYIIDNDDSFSAQVLNKISHGEKFIFQPNNNANNPSDFAICMLDEDSFSMKRTAFNVYDIEMKIREVW